MRSYHQYCSMARALDVVGDRWTLLIVRELLTLGPCRFTDLRHGLPGIASNLLAERLRELEAAGVLERHEAPPPVAATLLRLTERGLDLRGLVGELTRWGAPLMAEPAADDTFRMHWFALPARYLCRDATPDRPPTTVRLGDPADGCDITAGSGRVAVRPCAPEVHPDATVAAPVPVLVALFTGQRSLRAARGDGLELTGSERALRRILPTRERSNR